MELSKRAQTIQASPIRKLMPFADRAKKKGVKIYHLNIGQPDIETPQEMLDVYKNYHEKVLAYGPSQGLEVYRNNLVKYYQRHKIEIEKDDIIVTTAGSEAIIFAMMITCNAGDEIIIPEPFYTNYNGFATMAGVNIIPLTTYAENGFSLPENEKIEALITEKTKAVMICNPGNPTGTVYSKEDLKRIAEIAVKHDLFVISDEVYREFVYDGLSHTSILEFDELENKAIMVDSISKRYSACGARIGCLVSKNNDLMSAALKFAQARLCPPTIDQLAANAAIDIEEEYFKKILKEYDKRRNIVFEELQKIEGVVCVKPQGAFYVFPDISKLFGKTDGNVVINDSVDLSMYLLNDAHVATVAGSAFGDPNCIRLSYAVSDEKIKDAVNRIKKSIEKLT